jgi:hypothetical protein
MDWLNELLPRDWMSNNKSIWFQAVSQFSVMQ